MTDQEIEQHRIFGDVILVLKDGSEEEVNSLLRVIGLLCGKEEKFRLEEWRNTGMEGA